MRDSSLQGVWLYEGSSLQGVWLYEGQQPAGGVAV